MEVGDLNIAANKADLAVDSVSLRGISPTSLHTSVTIAKMWVVRNTQMPTGRKKQGECLLVWYS